MIIPINGTFNATAALPAVTEVDAVPNKWEVDNNNPSAAFLVYGILAFLLFSFFMIVIVDMMRKYRSGELRDTMSGFTSLVIAFVRIPCLIFTKDNLAGIWIRVTDIFRHEENKRRIGNEPETLTLNRGFDSQKIIDRLSSKNPLPPITKTTVSVSTPDLEAAKKVNNIQVREVPVATSDSGNMGRDNEESI